MIKRCHEIDVSLNDFVKDGSTFIKCYIRNADILLTPEEQVRQAILKVIYENLDLNTNFFITRVEFQNLDIAFYYNYQDKYFQPTQSPFLIIETKRDGTNLHVCKNQIINYLELNNCLNGLLLTCQTIYYLSSVSDYKLERIGLNGIKSIFNKMEPNLFFDIKRFNNARDGSIDDFKYLATKFNTSKVTFLCVDYSAPITAFLFLFKQDYIFYDICGVAAGIKKKRIKANNFLRLISISE
ncbi:MAG: hypothetical protein P9F19_18395 [Candidatus Contendobacter sp.]|nr:hypothetical protein [Candidatus Contendobacter sp.]MDG4559338.1 hypothetical protein [Candidatus Contendobacter sp.]